MSRKGVYHLPICILLTVLACIKIAAQSLPEEGRSLNHDQWGLLLEKYVDQDGNVDYTAFIEDTSSLDDYLKYLASFEPGEDWSRTELLAFYINLYNAATVKLILQHYPVASIRKIKQPWARKWIKVGNKELSLNQIEHKILRRLNEPRIHFAINCASASCPKLLNIPFEGKTLEEQLEKVTREFINDPGKNQFGIEIVRLSALFKWYKGDFTKDGSLLNYLSRYTNEPILANAMVQYLKYDWSLNEQ